MSLSEMVQQHHDSCSRLSRASEIVKQLVTSGGVESVAELRELHQDFGTVVTELERKGAAQLRGLASRRSATRTRSAGARDEKLTPAVHTAKASQRPKVSRRPRPEKSTAPASQDEVAKATQALATRGDKRLRVGVLAKDLGISVAAVRAAAAAANITVNERGWLG